MELDVWEALERGFRKTFEDTGLTLIVVFFLIGLVGRIAGESLRRYMLQSGIIESVTNASTVFPLAWIGPPSISILLAIAVVLMSLLATIVGVRTFLNDKRNVIPQEYYSQNLVRPLINLVIGGIVAGLVIAIGLVLLILPGLYLMLALFFWTIIVIDKEMGFFQAMKDSWRTTKGFDMKASLILLMFLLLAISYVLSLAAGVVAGISGMSNSFGGILIEVLISAVLTIFQLAVVVEAYLQASEIR
ncbi:MAG: hypothetical protein SVV03_00845 [Candidatus Nanohaloarchaea archaeon]|nr:hypothetical protein [Candidatus Nanohaloarchaea archaeon]